MVAAPVDAPLIERIVQPAFDALYIRAGIPVTLVAAECWLAHIVAVIGEAVLHALADPAAPKTRHLATALAVTVFYLIAYRAACARHRKWCDDPVSMAGTLPSAYVSFAFFRCMALAMVAFLSMPHDLQDLMAGEQPLEQILGILADTTLLLALYADACRTLPPRREAERRGHGLGAPLPTTS